MDKQGLQQKPAVSNQAQEKKKPSIAILLTITITALALIAVGAFYIIRKYRHQNQPAKTAEQIRGIFNLPSSTTPNFVPPEPSWQDFPPPFTASTSVSSLPPVQPQKTNNSPAIPPRGQQTPQAQNPTSPNIYQSTALDFQITLPAGWTAQEQNGKVFVYNQTGQQEGYIESYDNTGATLDSLEKIYQGSPSVKQINQITLNGQPALQYTAYNPAANGIIIINGNRLYYLYGALASADIASGFNAGTGTPANQYNPLSQNNLSGGTSSNQNSRGSGIIYYNSQNSP